MPYPSTTLPTTSTLLASAARTATVVAGPQANNNPYYSGCWVIVNVTAINTAGIYRPDFQVLDPVSGLYVTVATVTTNITATGTFAYYFGPHATAIVGGAAPGVAEYVGLQLPHNFQVNMVLVSGTGQTFSVGQVLVP